MDGLRLCGKAFVELRTKSKFDSGLKHFTDIDYHKNLELILKRVFSNNLYKRILIVTAGICYPLVATIKKLSDCSIDIITKHPGNYFIDTYYLQAKCKLINKCPIFDDISYLVDNYDLILVADNHYLVKPSMLSFYKSKTDILGLSMCVKDNLSPKYTVYQPKDVLEYQLDWSFNDTIDSDQLYYNNNLMMFVLGHNRKL